MNTTQRTQWEALLARTVRGGLRNLLPGPCGVCLDIETINGAGTVSILCCGILIHIDSNGQKRILVDGSDYIDREGCQLIAPNYIEAYELDGDKAAFVLQMQGGELLIATPSKNRTEPSLFISRWAGEISESEQLERFVL